jgi:hypothetical protein
MIDPESRPAFHVPIRLSCDRCVFREHPKHRGHCADCVVTHLSVAAEDGDCGRDLLLDTDEHVAVARLVSVGLLPSLKHREAS